MATLSPASRLAPVHGATGPAEDVLSDVLRAVRLAGSVQFCMLSRGAWRTDDKPALGRLGGGAAVIPFHVVVRGTCWLDKDGRRLALGPGDIVALPFDAGHALGAGEGGPRVFPVADLPPRPWPALPLLVYGADGPAVELLCGYLRCEGLSFGPIRGALPPLLLGRGGEGAGWLGATVARIVAEVEAPQAGGRTVLERLTEIAFVELLRREIVAAGAGAVGLLAALADPRLARCLGAIHGAPERPWTVEELAGAAGLSRSQLTARFEAVLGLPPIRYLRDWRLQLARDALATTRRPIAAIADAAGYGTEAAFSRAFARAFGLPPAAWRHSCEAV